MAKRPIILHQGAPEWMVTFGDMMSLLLTFFILLFSVAKLKDSGRVYDMIYAIQGTSPGSRPVHGFLLPNYDAIVDDLRDESESERRNFGERGVHSRRVIQSEGDGLYSLRIRDQLKITIEGSVLFDEGEVLLREEGKTRLARLVVPRLRDGPFRIMVRGHCAPGEANGSHAEDDLGYQRAREVRDFFVTKGIPEHRFEIQTIGSRSASAGEDLIDPAVRQLHRRVEVFVSPQATGLPVEYSRRG